MKKASRVLMGILAPVLMFALLFGFWEFICVSNNIPKWLLPSPSAIFTSMAANFVDFFPHIMISFGTVLAGFLLAVPIGILLATLITSSKALSAALSPYIIVLVTTPLVTLLPLLMLFLGYGQKVRIIGVVIQAFAIVNMNTCTGMLNVPVIRHELMQSVGATKLQSLRHVVYPTAALDIFTGVRLSAIFATTACVAAEYVGGNEGLGALIIKYAQYLKTTESFACIFFVTIIGLFMYGLVSFLQKKVVYWRT